MAALFAVIFADLVAVLLLEHVSRSGIILLGIIETVSIISIILAGRWYVTAHETNEENLVMSLMLKQLAPDEVQHVLNELQALGLPRQQQRRIERIFAQQCKQTVTF